MAQCGAWQFSICIANLQAKGKDCFFSFVMMTPHWLCVSLPHKWKPACFVTSFLYQITARTFTWYFRIYASNQLRPLNNIYVDPKSQPTKLFQGCKLPLHSLHSSISCCLSVPVFTWWALQSLYRKDHKSHYFITCVFFSLFIALDGLVFRRC